MVDECSVVIATQPMHEDRISIGPDFAGVVRYCPTYRHK